VVPLAFFLCQIRQRIGSCESPKRFHALALSFLSPIGVGEYPPGSSDKLVGLAALSSLSLDASILAADIASYRLCLFAWEKK
jgi:hypothetical protein